ncbi:General transcription factor IIF subunit 2 [Anabarilius grahami]|uniref:General transcription factor IIF subunit 2 n=1 Tax=Anabarilius grahami TaxID=495550 RepID=A0A3N0ZAD8_ANAGA|nr:General transcription factor IIF subunit 2 [Anabarilius grahami]
MVVQRAECRPAVSESYMKLKKLQIEESTKPLRFSQKLEKAITTNYKPVSNHSHNVEYEKRKKEEGKRARADKQKVLEMLFSAFEKHQYYNIRDLVDITKQPVKEEGKRARADKQKVLEMLFSAFEKHQYYNIRDLVDITKQPVIYLKEILREICVYNSRGPHKSTWELKPEYRHYEEGQEEEEEKME